MLTVLWKDFEKEPLHKAFLKPPASILKIPLPPLFGMNHSDYFSEYAPETNGDQDNSMSSQLSFMEN